MACAGTSADVVQGSRTGALAYGGVKRSSSLQKIISKIRFERNRKPNSFGSLDEGDFVIVNESANAFWTAVFSKHFIIQKNGDTDSDSRDDLLFFVRNVDMASSQKRYGSSNNLTQNTELVEVYRKDSKNLPSLGDLAYNWEETVYLNLIIQHFEYNVTCAICSRTGDRELQILRKRSQKVYASPSTRQMDTKGTEEIITYPDIFFTVDNFDEVFKDLVIKDSEMVCVELTASDKHGDFQAVLFVGSIRYEALKDVFDKKQSTLSSKMRQSFTWGIQTSFDNKRTEFLKMRGPQGKGYAQMAISQQHGGIATPGITPLTSPGETPEHEAFPSFPSTDPNQQEASNYETRRMSESAKSSPLKNGLKWSFGIRKSQSATESVSAAGGDNDMVQAKGIGEELHQPGMSLLGRSFGQAWHWFKEQRRAASVELNTCLTYVTLPWHRIIADVLDNKRNPVLSF